METRNLVFVVAGIALIVACSALAGGWMKVAETGRRDGALRGSPAQARRGSAAHRHRGRRALPRRGHVCLDNLLVLETVAAIDSSVVNLIVRTTWAAGYDIIASPPRNNTW